MQTDSLDSKFLEVLEKGGSITTLDAINVFKTVDARKILSNLRKKGYDIRDEWMKNEITGKRYKRYWLNPNKTQKVDTLEEIKTELF